MDKELRAIRGQLEEIGKAEAVKVWRLARRMEAHGVNPADIALVRAEGWELYNMGNGYPERLLDPFKKWLFAFK